MLLYLAYKRVKANKGAPGIDGMTVDEMGKFIAEHKGRLLESLLEGGYQPQPVREVEIPKPGGGIRQVEIPKGNGKIRPLGITTVEDRLVQRAVARILSAILEQDFLDLSYGYRQGRSPHGALKSFRSC